MDRLRFRLCGQSFMNTRQPFLVGLFIHEGFDLLLESGGGHWHITWKFKDKESEVLALSIALDHLFLGPLQWPRKQTVIHFDM